MPFLTGFFKVPFHDPNTKHSNSLVKFFLSESLKSDPCDVNRHDGKWEVLRLMLGELVNVESETMCPMIGH